MITQSRIILVRNSEGRAREYDPFSNTYTTIKETKEKVACLVNVLEKKRVLTDYGFNTEVIIACRFLNRVEPFDKAIYKGFEYVPIEQMDNRKVSVRLKRGKKIE